METITWAIGVLILIQIAVTGFLARAFWAHIVKCGRVSETLGGMAADLKRIQQDIGSHETGVRGQLHQHAGILTRHELDIEGLKLRRAR